MTTISPRQYVTAGNATFTVLSKRTNNRFTFRVRAPREGLPGRPVPLFVQVLTGCDNESDYTFLGSLFDRREYRHGARSQISPNAKSAQAFEWFGGTLTPYQLRRLNSSRAVAVAVATVPLPPRRVAHSGMVLNAPRNSASKLVFYVPRWTQPLTQT